MRHMLLAVLLCASMHAHAAPSQREAIAYLGGWLIAHGYTVPRIAVVVDGLPRGANAATVQFTDGTFEVRLLASALKSPTADRRLPNGLTQWQNLLLHEACHYIDILQRGTSDHGPQWRRLMRQYDVLTK